MARRRIAALEREAKKLESGPDAALLFHEIGRLWENPLKNVRNAAAAYQTAHKLAPKFLLNLRAARRLFGSAGNWQMVSQLFDPELGAAEDDGQKAALLFEKATVLEKHLSRRDEATEVYRQCLAIKPKDVKLLAELEAVFAERADAKSLIAIYRLLAQNLDDNVMRAQYLTWAGFLLEQDAKLAEASQCFLQAFQIERSNPLLLSTVIRVAERDGLTEELLAALAAQVTLEGPDAATTYLRIGQIYEQSGRKEDALAALTAARRLDPGEPLVLSQLAEIYESQERYQELAEVLLASLECISDPSEWTVVNLRLAALYEESLKRDEDAAARYHAVLLRHPGHSGALSGLGRLYYRMQNWRGLLQTFEMEAAATDDVGEKVARLYKAGEVLEERLTDHEQAIGRYNQCLQLLPGYLPAQQALAHLYEREARYSDLAAMYEQLLTQIADREQTLSILGKLAVVYEDRLSDVDRAIDCVSRILHLKPAHLPTIQSLRRLYQKASRWRDVIAMNEAEAGLVQETREQLMLHHRNAEILDDLLSDRAGAIAAYQRVLVIAPSYTPALSALGRLYTAEERWVELVRMYRAEAEIASSTEYAANLSYKIGQLLEEKLGDHDAAIGAYQEAITLAPSFSPALRALERIYRTLSEWERLIEMLRAEAANRNDPGERANALYLAASVWEEKLNRPDMAIACFEEVLRLAPNHRAASRNLERLYSSRNAFKDLIAVLDREAQSASNPAVKAAALIKLARVYLEVDEPSRAGQCCQATLSIDPGNISALKMLERIHAPERRRQSELKAQLAERVTDKRLRTALKVASAMAQDSPQNRMEELEKAFAEDPSDVRIADRLEAELRQLGDARRLVAFYQKRVSDAVDVTEKLELILQVAEIFSRQLNDPSSAVANYVQALELKPHLLPALQGVAEVSLATGDYAAAMGAFEAQGNSVHDPRSALDAFIAAGSIALEKLNEPDPAISFYRKALEVEPLDPVASSRLEQLLATHHRPQELAEMYQARGDAQLARGEFTAAAASLLQAARVWRSGVGDPKRALADTKKSLAARPNFADALEFEGDLLLQAEQHREAVEAYLARLQQGGSANVLGTINLKLGVVYQDQLADPNHAAAHLQAVISTDSKNTDALERLSRIYVESKNWTGAADCLQRLLDLEVSPSALAKHTLALARVYDEGFSDYAKASTLYRRALELGQSDLGIVDRLIELHRRTGTVSELLIMIERHADQAADGRRAAALWVKTAEVYSKTLNQAPKGVVCYRRALERDPQSIAARVGLADLYMRDPGSIEKSVAEHRELIRLDPMRVDSLHALFNIWKYLRQSDKAFSAAGILHFLRAANDLESTFYAEGKKRLPDRHAGRIQSAVETPLVHPAARGPLADVLAVIGDQLTKLYPPQLEQRGIDPKRDRLKSSHHLYKLVEPIAHLLGIRDFQLFQCNHGVISLATTDPFSMCIAHDFDRRFDPREQRFWIGRAAITMLTNAVVATQLSLNELEDLLGNAIRVFRPEFDRIGHPDDALVKKLKKAFSRKALRGLEEVILGISEGVAWDVENLVRGISYSGDRSGLLFSGDVGSSLGLLLRQDSEAAAPQKTEALVRIVAVRSDLRELAQFAIVDDYFEMRAKLEG